MSSNKKNFVISSMGSQTGSVVHDENVIAMSGRGFGSSLPVNASYAEGAGNGVFHIGLRHSYLQFQGSDAFQRVNVRARVTEPQSSSVTVRATM